MTNWHSIWLQPSAADLERLQATVDRLSARLHTQRFIPHLTLVEDMERSAEDLADVLDTHFAGETAFSAPVTGIHGLPQFFRSLYAGFAPAGRLKALKATAVDAFGTGSVETFMPHISLAYGVTEEQRQTVLAKLEQDFSGHPIRFDAIAVVNSAQSIPIEDWKIVHTLKLA
ncbi:2'-5' RNA ligase family protein [Rhizobium sp. C4]|uniref:2'-5' RNA ligase family protein n=1 Tax=Rhizobium sp. C4 TaxID=1349800 RepID=UPI001E5D0FDA|nr:2'-5' RNA ligase family protein [Rhizobium sp. C4]MCD2174827.1 2'-5' RNA ligase family protein [Rhizobium sp. C4]